jgi:hypothetical protein
MSRKIDDLDPRMKEKFLQFAGKMSEVGIPFMLACQDFDDWAERQRR